MAYEELGAVQVPPTNRRRRRRPRRRPSTRSRKLADYDAQRARRSLATLEEFLRRRGSISATSEALYVHPNTLRQRLRRIAELSGLDLRRDDWLMIEIAVKMVKLAAGARRRSARRPHICTAERWRNPPSLRRAGRW